MASLTDQISSPSAGKPVINPEAVQQAGPNPFAGLANAGSDFLTALNHRDAYGREREAGKAAAYRLGQAQHLDSAFDKIFSGIHDIGNQPQEVSIPSGIQSKIKDVQRMQTAEGQGRGPPMGSSNIAVSQLVDQVAAEYPDIKLDIYKEMHALGFDHPVLREAKLEADIEDKQTKDFADLPGIYAKAAADRGLALPGMSNAQVVMAGQTALKSENDFKQATALQDSVIKRKDQDHKQKDFDLKQADRQGGSAVIKLMQGKLGAVQQSVMSLYSSANGDLAKTKLLNETQENLTPAIESMRIAAKQQLAIANMATPENLALVDSTADMYNRAGKELFAGENSPYAVNKRSYEMLTQSLNLKNEEALPIWYRLKGIFGVGGLESILGTLPSLSPELRKSVEQEVSGFKTSEGFAADEHMATLARVLSGATGVDKLTEAQARSLMPSIAVATAGNAKHVIQNNDETSIPKWINGYSQIITASNALTPGAATDKDNMTATAILADHNSRVLIDRVVKNPDTKEQGLAMAAGSAAAAEQLLINLRHPGPAPYGSIEYKGGRFQPVFNDRLAALEANAKAGSVPAQKTLQEYKGVLTDKTNRMNQLVDHIMVMQQYNEASKGIKPIDLRNHFATGTPLPQGEEGGPNATKMFRQELARLNDTIKQLPSSIQTDPNLRLNNPVGWQNYSDDLSSAAQANGIPLSILEHLAHKENKDGDPSQKNVPAPGTKGSSATGLMQITKGTAEYLKVDPLNPQQAIEGGARYLKELYDKTGKDLPEAERWRRAVRMYGNTAPSNFKLGENDKAYKNLMSSWNNVFNNEFGP